jgi:hypothetical protein
LTFLFENRNWQPLEDHGIAVAFSHKLCITAAITRSMPRVRWNFTSDMCGERTPEASCIVAAFTHVDLPQVGGKLGLLVASAGHVFVGIHHFTPGLQVSGGLAFQ